MFIKSYNEIEQKRVNSELRVLFTKWVPASGAAEHMAGEIVRAANKLSYRFYNDGDHIGYKYGNYTCNAPARFLMNHTNSDIAWKIQEIWGIRGEKRYTQLLYEILDNIISFIKDNEEALLKLKARDMLDYYKESDKRY